MSEMNEVSLLPGFDAVLRDHKRLASKLTSDEFRAIRDYVEDRLRQEQADINFRLCALRNDFDVTVRRSSEAISDLYQELSDKKEIIKHYQTSDENITTIHKQKEERWDRKQELLVTEVAKLEGEAAKVKAKLENVESELEKKCTDIKDLEEKLVEANKVVDMVEEAERALKERDETKAEVLKLKLEVDKRDKQIHSQDKVIASMKRDMEMADKDKKYAELKVTAMKGELQKQVREVADKCKDLSQLQFELQMEKRQEETLQNQLTKAMEDVQNYKRMLESSRPALSPRNPLVITLRKDLDIMDIRIRSLDIGIRLRMDELKKLEDRLDDVRGEEQLIGQIRTEIYHQGDTFLELSASELVKKLDFKKRRLSEELKYARDWEQPRRDADMLRSEVTALMKQAAICKVGELSNRATKQLQKIDLIMRGTSETVKMPKIYKVSDRTNTDYRHVKKQRAIGGGGSRPFITSSTPISAFDTRENTPRTSRTQKRTGMTKGRSYRQAVLDNHTDDTKLHYEYIDTVELDLSRVTPTSFGQRGSQSDRLTLKSMSTETIPAITE